MSCYNLLTQQSCLYPIFDHQLDILHITLVTKYLGIILWLNSGTGETTTDSVTNTIGGDTVTYDLYADDGKEKGE